MSDCFDHAGQALESRFYEERYRSHHKTINPIDDFDIETEEPEEPKQRNKPTMNISYMQTVYDDSIKTVSVIFNINDPIMAKYYTYKTRLDFKEHDFGVVLVGNDLKVVKVMEVHEEPEIDPHDSKEYKWITIKLDVSPVYAAIKEDQEAKTKIRAHMRRKARKAAKAELSENFGGQFSLAPTNIVDEFDIESAEACTMPND